MKRLANPEHGVWMVVPILANIFMGHHKTNWLANYKSSNILIYRRYVDDTFCLFDNEQNTIMFF